MNKDLRILIHNLQELSDLEDISSLHETFQTLEKKFP